MHNRASFWKRFRSEPVNSSQKTLKSAEKYFYPSFSSFSGKLREKKLFSIRPEIVLVLDNTLTGKNEYSRSNRENLQLPIQTNLCKKL